MPFSVNSFGTGMFVASKKRTISRQTGYDAVEAFTGLFLPILPYKAIHVVNEGTSLGGLRTQYQALPLRFSPRLILKAYLGYWSVGFLIVGMIWTTLLVAIMVTEEKLRTKLQVWELVIGCGLILIGVLSSVAVRKLHRRDERIKDILGPHGYGSSDPIDWPSDVAENTTQKLLKLGSASSLVQEARDAKNRGDFHLAMLGVRLAMRTGRGIEAEQLFEQLLQTQGLATTAT